MAPFHQSSQSLPEHFLVEITLNSRVTAFKAADEHGLGINQRCFKLGMQLDAGV